MTTRRVRTGASYVADPGGGKMIWTPVYEDQEITASYVDDPGGGKKIWISDTIGDVWPDDAAKLLVFEGAGVTDGVTPGVLDRATGLSAGAYSTDYGHRTNNGLGDGSAPVVLYSGQATINVTNEAALTAHAVYVARGTFNAGTNTYTITNAVVYSPAGTSSIFIWNDTTTATPYHIKFVNCVFVFPDTTVNMFEVTDSAGGTLTFEDCQLGGGNNTSADKALVKIADGSVSFSRCFFTQSTGYSIWTAGATASVTVTDSKWDTTGGPWSGSFGSTAIFYNTVAGATINVSRTTFDHKSVSRFLLPNADCTVTLDRVLWNSSDSANPQGFINTALGASALNEPWIGGLTMTDCQIYNGSAAVPLLGHTDPNSNQTVANWTITNCEFIASGTRSLATRLIAIGDGDAGASGTCDNVLFSWCRFTKTQTTNTPAAGAEAVEFWRASNTIMEYCWVDQCGEDAYEWVQPYDNCGIRYCGGGEVSGSTVAGNMVDFYAGGSNWANSTNCFINRVWGTCKADAVIVEVPNVAVNYIDVTNSGADFTPNRARANVRLHVNAANGLNGVTVGTNLTAVAESWDSRPCYLTRESSIETTITGTEAAGQTVLTVASSASMLAGMLVGIELASNGTHQTTIVSVDSGTQITITDPIPVGGSKLNGEVYAIATFNAGTVSWPEWNGSAFVTRDGTAGGVAEMSSL